MKRIFFSIALGFLFAIPAASQLVTYNGIGQHNDDYTVRVRTIGGEWKDLFEYNVQVDMDNVQNASMVQFDMGEPVEVMVKKNNGIFHHVDIRPLSRNVKHRVEMNSVVFQLDKPQYLSVEFNGDRLHNLHLFANPLEKEKVKNGDDNVMFFGPGIHKPKDLPGIEIRIPNRTTVYLAPGAVVQAKLVVDHVEDVRIIGRGIIDHPQRGIEVTHSKNITIDGITVLNPDHYTVFGGETDGLTIRNLKGFSCKGWSDGIDLMSCSNVVIDNVFLRNSDDCIALYGHRWRFYGDSKNIVVQNSSLWADVAHTINIGGHGNAKGTGDILENYTFRNIDILEHDEDDPNYQGCMAIGCGDKNHVRSVLFEDIRIENFQEGCLFHLSINFNEKYNEAPGGSISDVTFRNIYYNGCGANQSVIKGYDRAHFIKGITFENVWINGEKMKDLENVKMNKFIENIKIK